MSFKVKKILFRSRFSKKKCFQFSKVLKDILEFVIKPCRSRFPKCKTILLDSEARNFVLGFQIKIGRSSFLKSEESESKKRNFKFRRAS